MTLAFLDCSPSTLKLNKDEKSLLPPPLLVGKQQNCAVQPTFGKEWDARSQVTPVGLSRLKLHSVTSCSL